MSNNGVYWSEFVNILDIQFHELLYIMDTYNDGSMSGSVAACISSIRGTQRCSYVVEAQYAYFA